MTLLLWSLVALPLTAGGLLVLAGRRADRFAWPVAVLVGVGSLGTAVAVAAGRPAVEAPWLAGLPVRLEVDGLSAVLVVTVAVVSLAVIVYAGRDLGPDERRARFFGELLLFVGAMLGTVTATNLGVLLAFWELMGAMSYALIGYWWPERRRVDAATTAFLVTRTADLGLYLACAAAVAGAGTLSLDQLAVVPAGWRDAVAAGVVLAALGKSAQIPFSYWLSKAMEGPSPVSALLHSATMVAAGAYLLLRVDDLLAATSWAQPTVAWFGAATALLLGLVAVAQTDLKQLLAASTCAQMGFLVLAAGVGGVAGGTAHLVAHAAVKSLLFLLAGALLHTLGTKDLRELTGAGARLRLLGGLAVVGFLTLAGVPPLSMWLTKDAILASALASSVPLYAVGLVAGAVSAVYAGKALVLLLLPAESPRDRADASPRLAAAMTAPMVALAAVSLVLAMVALPPVRTWLADMVGAPGAEVPTALELAASALISVAGLALVLGWRRGAAWRPVPVPAAVVGTLRRWLDVEAAARVLVVRPTLALAHALARVDGAAEESALRGSAAVGRASTAVFRWRWSIDGVVEAAARLGLVSARASDRVDERVVDRLVRGVAEAAARLGHLARRPQTGMVHHYYAQAVAVLAVLSLTAVLLAR